MGQLKRADIRSKPRMRKVATPEWGGKDTFVHVRALSVKGADTVDAIVKRMNKDKLGSIAGAAQICVQGICDSNGQLLYADATDLDEMEVAPLLRCMDVLLDLSGFGDTKEEEKNSRSRGGSSLSS